MRTMNTLFAVATLLALLAVPAMSDTLCPVHFKFSRSALAVPLDSTLITMTTASKDTSASFKSADFSPGEANAAVDTSAIGLGASTRVGLTVTVEVTGAMQSTDSLYCGYQVSEDGSRWVTAKNPLSSTAFGAVENNAGSQTFVFLLKSDPRDANNWVNHGFFRLILLGDYDAASKCFSTRASLTGQRSH